MGKTRVTLAAPARCWPAAAAEAASLSRRCRRDGGVRRAGAASRAAKVHCASPGMFNCGGLTWRRALLSEGAWWCSDLGP